MLPSLCPLPNIYSTTNSWLHEYRLLMFPFALVKLENVVKGEYLPLDALVLHFTYNLSLFQFFFPFLKLIEDNVSTVDFNLLSLPPPLRQITDRILKQSGVRNLDSKI